MPRTILPRRNRRCALSATGTQKPEEEKDARGVTYFMEENVISPCEVARFNEHIETKFEVEKGRAVFCLCLVGEHPSVYFAC